MSSKIFVSENQIFKWVAQLIYDLWNYYKSIFLGVNKTIGPINLFLPESTNFWIS
jgi:hypothetical protein